jgi:hypothetical protein
LSPHEVAVSRPLLSQCPPKPPSDQALDHGSVVTLRDIGLAFLGTIADIVMLEVQVEVNVVAEHILP